MPSYKIAELSSHTQFVKRFMIVCTLIEITGYATTIKIKMSIKIKSTQHEMRVFRNFSKHVFKNVPIRIMKLQEETLEMPKSKKNEKRFLSRKVQTSTKLRESRRRNV